MYDAERLSHTTWDCKYHLIWIPKYRKKIVIRATPKTSWGNFQRVIYAKGKQVVEGHLMPDHVFQPL